MPPSRILKGAIEAVVALAGHKMAETDPELGANLMVFFIRDWSELSATPGLDRLLPDLPDLVARLEEADANQYRAFRFETDGAIKAAFVFVRMDAHLARIPAETIALSQVVQTILLWSDTAFLGTSPLAVLAEGGPALLKPGIADLIRVAYDPCCPPPRPTRPMPCASPRACRGRSEPGLTPAQRPPMVGP
jgi:hypothetical protein